MNTQSLTVGYLAAHAERELLPGRLTRSGRIAEARRGRTRPGALVGGLCRAIGAGRFGAAGLRRAIGRRIGARPVPTAVPRRAAG